MRSRSCAFGGARGAAIGALLVGLPSAACRDAPRGEPAATSVASAPAEVASARPNGSASAPPRPATSAELRLLAPLAVGNDLAGFTVKEIRGVERGTMRVFCEKGRAVVRLDVALAPAAGADAGSFAPAATSGPYAIYYALRDAAPEDGERLAEALARIVHAKDPAPEGMAPFAPRPRPDTTL